LYALDPVTQHHVENVTDALVEEFAGIFSRETISRYIAESVDLLGEFIVRTATPRREQVHVDGGDLGAAIGCREHEVFGNLHAQLAGRNDDESLDAGLGVEAEGLEEGETEAERLARSGLGLTDDVLAGESHRDRLHLDREGFDDALGGKSVDHVLVDIEFGESHECMPVISLKGDAPVFSLGHRPPVHAGGVIQAYRSLLKNPPDHRVS